MQLFIVCQYFPGLHHPPVLHTWSGLAPRLPGGAVYLPPLQVEEQQKKPRKAAIAACAVLLTAAWAAGALGQNDGLADVLSTIMFN